MTDNEKREYYINQIKELFKENFGEVLTDIELQLQQKLIDECDAQFDKAQIAAKREGFQTVDELLKDCKEKDIDPLNKILLSI